MSKTVIVKYQYPPPERLVQATPAMIRQDQSIKALGGDKHNYEAMNLMLTAEQLVQPTVQSLRQAQNNKAFSGSGHWNPQSMVYAGYDNQFCCNKGVMDTKENFSLPYDSNAVAAAETQQLYDSGHDFIMFPDDYIMTNANLDPRDHTKVKYRWNGFLKLSEAPSYSLCTGPKGYNEGFTLPGFSPERIAKGTPRGPLEAQGLRSTSKENFESCVNNDAIDNFIYPPRHCMYNAEGYMTCHNRYLGY